MLLASTETPVHKVHCEGFSHSNLYNRTRFVWGLSMFFLQHNPKWTTDQSHSLLFWILCPSLQCLRAFQWLHNVIKNCDVLFVSHHLPRDKHSLCVSPVGVFVCFCFEIYENEYCQVIFIKYRIGPGHFSLLPFHREIRYMLFNTKFEEKLPWWGLTGSSQRN